MISLRSEITKKILSHFFLNPADSLYVNELSKRFDLDKRNVVKKLREFEKEGILRSEKRGNLKLYSINSKHPLYDEYRKIILKTVGFENQLREAIEKIDGIKELIIYGSYAKNKMDTHSDIDLLAVGSHSLIALQRILNKLQQELGREINVVNMDEAEFKKRIKKKDPFVSGILKERHLRII